MSVLYAQVSLLVATMETIINVNVQLFIASNPECEDGDVRLVGGVSTNQGRVEICYNGIWGSVCGEGVWSQEEAAVVCNQLGYDQTKTSMPHSQDTPTI